MPAETDLQRLAQKTLRTKNPSYSWIWKVLAGVAVAVTLWFFQWQLDKKKKELARAKTELETQRIRLEYERFLGHVSPLNETIQKKQAQVVEKLKLVRVMERARQFEEEQNNKLVAQLEAIKSGDWAALNQLAGVE